MFKGSIVAIVTPFRNGKVDEQKLSDLIEFQIKNGTSGIVPCGTTGESATLSFEEHDRVIELTIDQAKLLKDCLGVYCSPLVYGQICEFLESSNGTIPKKE